MNMGFVPPGEGVFAGTGDRESCCNGGPHHGRLMSRTQGGRAAVMRGGCGMLRTPPGTKWVGKGRDCFLGRQSLCKDFDCFKHRLSQLLCDSRRMNTHVFKLLLQGSPTEVCVKDCSWLTEEEFTKCLQNFDPSNLVVLFFRPCT